MRRPRAVPESMARWDFVEKPLDLPYLLVSLRQQAREALLRRSLRALPNSSESWWKCSRTASSWRTIRAERCLPTGRASVRRRGSENLIADRLPWPELHRGADRLPGRSRPLALAGPHAGPGDGAARELPGDVPPPCPHRGAESLTPMRPGCRELASMETGDPDYLAVL